MSDSFDFALPDGTVFTIDEAGSISRAPIEASEPEFKPGAACYVCARPFTNYTARRDATTVRDFLSVCGLCAWVFRTPVGMGR